MEASGVDRMKRVTINRHRKSKAKKQPAKNAASASIATRYMELRRLRQQLSEAEAQRNTR
jgi:hypothetical protein